IEDPTTNMFLPPLQESPVRGIGRRGANVGTGTPERFRTKHALGLDPWVDIGSRKENASKHESGAPFRFHRNGNGSSNDIGGDSKVAWNAAILRQ
ncbi:MAG: hypothetical protein KGK16_01130, partial [Bradyrhizobium sp.]|nr:hypothetical protein [Bradyrhizobium sp.]